MAVQTAIFNSVGAPSFFGGGFNAYYGASLGWELVGGDQVDAAAGDRFFNFGSGDTRTLWLADGLYVVTARLLAHAVWDSPSRPDGRSLTVESRLALADVFTGGGGIG